MADPRFFSKAQPMSVQDIAELSGSEIQGDHFSQAVMIDDVAPLHEAGESHISFLDNIKYKDDFKKTKAAACFLSSKMIEHAPEGLVLLVSDNPYKSYALTAQAFYPDHCPSESIISGGAHIHAQAQIGNNVTIGAGVVIAADVEISDGVVIGAGASIGQGVKIGEHTRIGPNAAISHAIIGAHCHLYPGVCIGQDGFGFAIDPAGHVKVPQLGRVIIEDHVHIGANSTVDRGSGPDTVIGQGTWIDNLVQIAHNVKIGRGCVMVAQSGISGSSVLEDYVVVAGQVGIAGHLKIGMGARIAAQSGVMRDVPPGTEYFGTPAVPKRDKMKQVALLNRLIKNKK